MRLAPLPTAASALPLLLLLPLSSCALNSTARREKAAAALPASSAAAAPSPVSAPAPSSLPSAVAVTSTEPVKVPFQAAATVVDPGRFEKSPADLTEPFLEKPDSFFDKDKTTVSGSISVAVGYEKTSYPRVSRIGRNSGYGSPLPGSP